MTWGTAKANYIPSTAYGSFQNICIVANQTNTQLDHSDVHIRFDVSIVRKIVISNLIFKYQFGKDKMPVYFRLHIHVLSIHVSFCDRRPQQRL